MRTIAPAVALVILAVWLVPYQVWASALNYARENPGLALAVVAVLAIATVVYIRGRESDGPGKTD
jgi:hypothetical protein